MIGDYINDINSYHLHMFDKHDVTTKKFDAIVEKAGKVDANYAAQIEGYCSLLGEYGKKFEAVCAMLQPEKLRLSPDKYREKLEGINTGYQNAKDTHEQEQSDYEAELYEIETVWYKKMLDKAEDYLIRSAECIVLGNFTDEVTVLGVGVQIVLGIFDLDLPCDIRDIIADIKNLAETDRVRWDLIGMLALDLIGLIPVIGALKYSDEVGTLFKNAGKVSVVAEGADGVGAVARHSFKDILQELMEAELDATLGYEKNHKGDLQTDNKRNGHSTKNLKSQYGEFQIDVPRDQNGEFEPKLIPKYQRGISGIEEKVISLYARGMSTRHIHDQLQDLYGIELSAEMVSKITDKILPQVK